MISADFTHPMLEGCRVFMYPISPAANVGWVNLSPLWIISVSNGLDAASEWGQMTGAHGAIKTGAYSPGAGTAAAYYSYWNDVWPTDDVRDFTIIARLCYRGSDPGSGAGGFAVGARGTGNNGGFLFGVWDAGGSDDGLACFMYSTSGVKIFTDQQGFAGLSNYPTVAAFTFEAGVGRFTMYRDGAMTRQTTDVTSAFTPYVDQANKQLTIGRADVGFAFNGEIGWVAIFARCLSHEEIVAWSQDGDWPFVWEDPTFLLENAEATFTTTVTANSTVLPSTAGAVTFTTTIDAEFFVEGDFEIEPEPPAVGTYTTIIGVGSTAYYDSPEFGVFITLVGVSSQITATAPVTFTTSVGVRSDARGLIDGRTDLIDTERYIR